MLSPFSCGLLSTFSSLSGGALMAFAFEKLLVYQKAIDFSDAVCAKSECFPRDYGFPTDQLNRAALSIPANIAEGNGRFTKPDRRNSFGIARGFRPGVCSPLELARRRGLLEPADHAVLKSQVEEIARMLSGLISGLDTRER